MSPVFGHGSLRLYLLKLLDEAPRHGYDLIRLLEDRFMGTYAPSAGTIYPRLARLETEGLITHSVEDGKKIYRLTDRGRAELQERAEELADLEADISRSVHDRADEVREQVRGSLRDVREELKHAARDIRRQQRHENRQQKLGIKDELREAKQELKEARQGAQGSLAGGRERLEGRASRGPRHDQQLWPTRAGGRGVPPSGTGGGGRAGAHRGGAARLPCGARRRLRPGCRNPAATGHLSGLAER